MQFPYIVLTEVRLRESKAWEGEEGKVLQCGFCSTKSKEYPEKP
jgi:hypothetical protein